MRSEGVLDLNCSAVVMHLYAVYCFKMFIFYFFSLVLALVLLIMIYAVCDGRYI